MDHIKIPEHLDHDNQHTFEIDDLRKLILQTTADLTEADRKRREEFKVYPNVLVNKCIIATNFHLLGI